MATKKIRITLDREVVDKALALKPLINTVIGEEILKTDEDYIEFILTLGIDKVLTDPLPDNKLLRETIKAMFRKNPKFVAEFIAETLKKAEQKELIEKSRKEWKIYM